jgi:hypothetical protein
MLQELDLLYQYELPLSLTVTALIDRVTLAMQNSSSQYQFATTPRRAPSQHLTLLALLNRGVARRSDTQIRLTPIALEDDATLRFLATDRHRFAHEKCVDRGNQFVIHFGQYYDRHSVLWYSCRSFSSAVSRFPVKHIENGRLHSCISARVTYIFPRDNEFREEDGSWCESEGELLDDEDDEDELPMTPTPRVLVGVLSTIGILSSFCL